MSITPPSDLVLDVARAVEPSQYRAAVAKLQLPNSGARGDGTPQVPFDDFVKTAQIDKMRPPLQLKQAQGSQEAYRKFESLMLQNFIDAMFTSDTDSVFGAGAGANYWKSMMIETMADEMSQAGGIGLAEMMENNHPLKPPQTRNIVAAAANVVVHQNQLDLIRHLNKVR